MQRTKLCLLVVNPEKPIYKPCGLKSTGPTPRSSGKRVTPKNQSSTRARPEGPRDAPAPLPGGTSAFGLNATCKAQLQGKPFLIRTAELPQKYEKRKQKF